MCNKLIRESGKVVLPSKVRGLGLSHKSTHEKDETRNIFFYICERCVMLCDENFMSHDTHAIKLTSKTIIAWFTTLIHTLNCIKSFNFIDNLPYFFTKISNSRRRISLLEFPIIRKRLREWNWEQNSRPAWHFPSPISLGRRKRVPESRELLMLFCHALLSLKVRAQTQHVGLHDAVENILNFIERKLHIYAILASAMESFQPTTRDP